MSVAKNEISTDGENPHRIDAQPVRVDEWSALFSYLQRYTYFDVARIKAHIERLEQDAARYRAVKTLSREQLLLWRGAFGYSDDSIDDMK